MAGETGGLDESTHTRIEEWRCGYEYFSGPGLTVEKNFARTKPMKTSVPFLPGFPWNQNLNEGAKRRKSDRKRAKKDCQGPPRREIMPSSN
jgi:hypothetical protein